MPLLRGVARTAAIAGTATAVSNRVSRRQQGRWAEQEQAQFQQQQQQQPPTPVQQQPQTADDPVAKLEQLGQLHQSGVLTDEEFTAAKAKIIG